MSQVNARLLRAKMVERDVSMSEISRRLKMNQSTMFRKLRGDSEFTVGEMQKIASELDLSANEAMTIFLPAYSH